MQDTWEYSKENNKFEAGRHFFNEIKNGRNRIILLESKRISDHVHNVLIKEF